MKSQGGWIVWLEEALSPQATKESSKSNENLGGARLVSLESVFLPVKDHFSTWCCVSPHSYPVILCGMVSFQFLNDGAVQIKFILVKLNQNH